MGNEWNTACCALFGILFVAGLVKGKYHPRQAGPLEFEDIGGNTVGLLLHMMKSYFATGRYVIIDCDLYVLKGFIQLSKKGIFACAVIKKIRYWSYIVPGNEMGDHFGEVEVGETDAILVTVHGAIYNLWGMKEPNCVMRMISTVGSLLAYDTCKETVRRFKVNGEYVVKKFKYKLPFDWHFVTAMRLMTTTTSCMQCHHLKIQG